MHAYSFITLFYLDMVFPDVPKKTKIQLGRSKVVYGRVIKEYEVEDDLIISFTDDMLGMTVAEAKAAIKKKTKRHSVRKVKCHLKSEFVGLKQL